MNQSNDVLSSLHIAAALEWNLERPKTFLIIRKDFDPLFTEELEREYKRYLALIGGFPMEKFPISNVVDELWHSHLLFTDDYHDMSDRVRGEYIHHIPTLSEEERKTLETDYFGGTLRRYEELFGTPSEKFWPSDSGSICWSCSSPYRPTIG